MGAIDPTARVEDGASVAGDAEIGPFCLVGRNVTIGPGTRLVSHVSIVGHTKIGAACTIYPFAALGGPPQDLGYRGEPIVQRVALRLDLSQAFTVIRTSDRVKR